jgi:intracellular septation protein A
MSKRNQNQLLNLLINIIVPVIVLTRFSGPEWLGQTYGLIVALAFPVVYGVYDLYKEKKFNLFSVIGVVSILLTGGIGLLQLDNKWLAIKEAGVPFILGVAVLVSQYTKWPLMKILFEPVINHEKVDIALREHNAELKYEKRFTVATRIVAGSFFLSAILNYVLAKIIVVSPPGTVEYNAELGHMTALSYPVIAVPSMIIFIAAALYLIFGIEKMTLLSLQDIVKH